TAVGLLLPPPLPTCRGALRRRSTRVSGNRSRPLHPLSPRRRNGVLTAAAAFRHHVCLASLVHCRSNTGSQLSMFFSYTWGGRLPVPRLKRVRATRTNRLPAQ